MNRPAKQEEGSLAAALATARLKRTKQVEPESPYGTVRANGGGMASMMDEMAKTLARRRAVTDNHADGDSKRAVENGSKVNGAPPESPKPGRRARVGSIPGGDEVRVECQDIERLKQEILTEMRKEMHKLKMDIIDAIKVELNRR